MYVEKLLLLDHTYHPRAETHSLYSSSVKQPTKEELDMVDVHCWAYHSLEEQDV